jgi:hemolysin activation/secretion protein
MRGFRGRGLSALIALVSALCVVPAHAEQTPIDRADPAIVKEELRQEAPAPSSAPPMLQAPVGAPASGGVDRPIFAGAILIIGAEAVPQAAFGAVVERYAGRTLSGPELRALAGDVAAVARNAGYGLATAWIPEQTVETGVLRIRVDEGRIDAIEVQGEAQSAVESRLAGLADGRPVRTDRLERRLLLAGDIAGVRLGKTRLDRRAGRNVLVVPTFRDRVAGRFSLDNWGSATAGPLRARFGLEANGLLASDDGLVLDVLTMPLSPREFALVASRYTASVDTQGTELSVGGYVARSEAGGSLRALDLDGRSHELELELRHPVVRSRASGVWMSLGARVRESEQTRADRLVREDRLTMASGNVYAFRRLKDGRARARLTIVQGVDAFGSNAAGDPLSSRRDADGRFTKIELWGDIEHRFGRGLSILAQAEGQWADGPLLSSEEMGLGGRRFGRAWDYREFSGDRGLAGSIELRRDLKRPTPAVEAAQLYLFADGGKVDNCRLGMGGGSLASAGGGVRLWLKNRLRAGIELGLPLTNGIDRQRDPSPRASFTLDIRF